MTPKTVPRSDRPVVPDHLEETFLVKGPRVFSWLVEQSGGNVRAASVARVSNSTFSRWMNTSPGSVFGPRQDLRSYRSMWFGYPSPFPGLDRIVEEIYGVDEDSFLRRVIHRLGLKETLRWLQGSRGFGLEMLDLTDGDQDMALACERVGIPATTRRRWYCGVRYPKQWAALDRICEDRVSMSWLEAVLVLSPDVLPRRVSKGALSCMVQDALQNM